MNSNTGIIFESKNGRWVITRGKGRWNVTDNDEHVKASVLMTDFGLTCNASLPGYVLKHIEKDAALLEAIQKREEMGV